MKNEQEKITKTELKERGWTERLMGELLPEPQYKRNPHGGQYDMKLWVKNDVEEAEKTNQFQEHLRKRKKNVERAKKIVEKRYEKTRSQAQSIIGSIHIKKMPMETLRNITISIQQEYYEYKMLHCNNGYEFLEYNAESADEDTIKRWMVNTLRHNFTSYDSHIEAFKGTVGGKIAMLNIRNEILKAIGETYPDLKDECKRQIKKGEERAIARMVK